MLKGVFLDLSGVLYEGPTPLPGAVDAVARLQASGLLLRFVTNTSRRGRRQLLADFDNMGFAIDQSQLVTAPSVTADWLRAYLERYQAERRVAILLASHNMAEVERLCDRVVMMKAGRVVDEAPPEALLRKYGRTNLEEVFLDIARDRRAEPAPREPRPHPHEGGEAAR